MRPRRKRKSPGRVRFPQSLSLAWSCGTRDVNYSAVMVPTSPRQSRRAFLSGAWVSSVSEHHQPSGLASPAAGSLGAERQGPPQVQPQGANAHGSEKMFAQIHLGDPDGGLTMRICRKPGRSSEREEPRLTSAGLQSDRSCWCAPLSQGPAGGDKRR